MVDGKEKFLPDKCLGCDANVVTSLFRCPFCNKGYPLCSNCRLRHTCQGCKQTVTKEEVTTKDVDTTIEYSTWADPWTVHISYGFQGQPLPCGFQGRSPYDYNVYVASELPQREPVSHYLCERLEKWYDCVQLVYDQRENRETKSLKLYGMVAGAIPPDLRGDMFWSILNDVMQNVDTLAFEIRPDMENPSPGCIAIQKTLVLAPIPQKLNIISILHKDAKRLLYHESGCFVVSQILQEALSTQEKSNDVLEVAHNFMVEAHTTVTKEGVKQNLLKSMRQAHANHAFKMWIKLLSQSKQMAHGKQLEMIWDVLEKNSMKMLINRQGIRSAIALLEHFLVRMPCKTEAIMKHMTDDQSQLDALIRDEYANHAVQIIVEYKPEEISTCVWFNFLAHATHPHANYVLQACISSPACIHWLTSFADAFMEHEAEIKKYFGHASFRNESGSKKKADGYEILKKCLLTALRFRGFSRKADALEMNKLEKERKWHYYGKQWWKDKEDPWSNWNRDGKRWQ